MVRGRTRSLKKEMLKIIYFRLVNRFVRNGNKDFVFRLFFNALIETKRKTRSSFRVILDRFFFRLRPLLQLKPLFSSGIIYQLPSTLNSSKEYSMAVFWFYKGVRERSERTLQERFSKELLDIWYKKGYALQFKKNYYNLIVQNRIFLYRFKKRFRI
jgi:small subunit ribosomal protein S7